MCLISIVQTQQPCSVSTSKTSPVFTMETSYPNLSRSSKDCNAPIYWGKGYILQSTPSNTPSKKDQAISMIADIGLNNL